MPVGYHSRTNLAPMCGYYRVTSPAELHMSTPNSTPDAPPSTSQPQGPPSQELVSALIRILQAHWVMSLATLSDDERPGPYSTPLFYALDEDARRLVFASSPNSRHGRHIEAHAAGCPSSAALYLESENVGELRGAQLRGVSVVDARPATRALYLARHPVAAPVLEAGRHRIYAFAIHWAKLTDNRLGFGVHPELQFDPPAT